MMKSSQFMPEDLLIAILERLPVISLLRFKCVSKSWCNLIKNPMFVNCHLQKQLKNDGVLLVSRCLREKRVFSLHDLASPGFEQAGRDIHIPDNINRPYSKFVLIGSFNGIVCLAYGHSVVLCNPALEEFKSIPGCPFACEPGFTSWGFCSNIVGSFIVVQLQYTYTMHTLIIEAFLYDSGTNSWRKSKNVCNLPIFVYTLNCNTIFFMGACHWPIYRNGRPALILTLNVSNDEIGVLNCPDSTTECGDWLLKVMDECLAIVWYKSFHITDIWVMKEYGVKESWTKQLVLELNHITRPLLRLKNDLWMLNEGIANADQLPSYKLGAREIKRYGVRGSAESFQTLIYNDSLITLD